MRRCHAILKVFLSWKLPNRLSNCVSVAVIKGDTSSIMAMINLMRKTFDIEFVLDKLTLDIDIRRRLCEELSNLEKTYLRSLLAIHEVNRGFPFFLFSLDCVLFRRRTL